LGKITARAKLVQKLDMSFAQPSGLKRNSPRERPFHIELSKINCTGPEAQCGGKRADVRGHFAQQIPSA
jgi:hypothetical protein